MKKQLLYGPKSHFSYMKFGEFIYLDILFANYIELYQREKPKEYQAPVGEQERAKRLEILASHVAETKQALNKFCAAIMRPKNSKHIEGSSSDIREAFSDELIEHRAKAFNHVNSATKLAILHNFALVRESIVRAYPLAFGSSGADEKEKISASAAARSWLNIRSSIAGNILNLEKVDELLLSDVLSSLKPSEK